MNKLVTKLLSQSLTQQEFNNLLPNKINELGLKTALELIHIILPASIHPIKIPIIICLIIQVKNGHPLHVFSV